MRFLGDVVRDSLLDSLHYLGDKSYPRQLVAIPKPRRWHAFLCDHDAVFDYERIDHRAGPGSFADNFEGRCCLKCGAITQETQTA